MGVVRAITSRRCCEGYYKHKKEGERRKRRTRRRRRSRRRRKKRRKGPKRRRIRLSMCVVASLSWECHALLL